MQANREPTFTLAEVTGALSGLDVTAQQTVLGALQGLVDEREANRAEEAFTRSVFNFAVVYHRAVGENVSDSNIGGWHDGALEEAEKVLKQFGGRTTPLSDTETWVRNMAAVSSTFFLLQRAGEEDQDVLDLELLENAGVDTDWLLYVFRAGMVQYEVAKGVEPEAAQADIDERYRGLDDFRYKLEPDHGTYILDPFALAMRTRLQADGFNLPELNAEGKYNDDDQQPMWQPTR